MSVGPFTLSVDCGGTGLKCLVLDREGVAVSERVRIATPYPCPPALLADTLRQMAQQTGVEFDRVSVGMPGLVRRGLVRWTPHYVTESGPFSPVRSDLAMQWENLDVRALLESTFERPTLVVNDAELAGLSVITGHGYEVMLTLGTGLGFAHYSEGALLPKIEVSATPFRKGQSFDERLGNHARRARGTKAWSKDVQRGLDRLFAVYSWDRAYLGGGGAKHLARRRVDEWVTVVDNTAGIKGGVRLWDDQNAHDAARPLRPADS
ncbi:MAG: ROK family protein [Jiangellales bacterium]